MVLNIVAPVGRILLKEIVVEKKSTGGIILAGNSDPDNKAKLGEVVSNGILVEGKPNRLYSEGNKVFIGKFAGAVVEHDNQKYLSVLESEVVAIAL